MCTSATKTTVLFNTEFVVPFYLPIFFIAALSSPTYLQWAACPFLVYGKLSTPAALPASPRGLQPFQHHGSIARMRNLDPQVLKQVPEHVGRICGVVTSLCNRLLAQTPPVVTSLYPQNLRKHGSFHRRVPWGDWNLFLTLRQGEMMRALHTICTYPALKGS